MDGGSKFWHKRASSSSSSLTQNKHHRMNFNQKSLSSTPIRWAYWRLLTMIYSSSAFDVEELWILSCLENSISVCGTSDLPVKYKHLYTRQSLNYEFNELWMNVSVTLWENVPCVVHIVCCFCASFGFKLNKKKLWFRLHIYPLALNGI